MLKSGLLTANQIREFCYDYVNYKIPYYRLGLSETRANITVKL